MAYIQSLVLASTAASVVSALRFLADFNEGSQPIAFTSGIA